MKKKIVRFIKSKLLTIRDALYKLYCLPYMRKYLALQAKKYATNINDIFDKNALFAEIESGNDKAAIRSLFKGKFYFGNECAKNADIAIIWGLNTNHCNIKTIKFALQNNVDLFIAEDGFLRSIHTWSGANERIPARFRQSMSFTFGNLPYFYADSPNSLEFMLQDKKLTLNPAQIKRARDLINKIIANKLSKYNHQPIFTPQIGQNKSKVLVIDQSYGDMSIAHGGGHKKIFDIMLECAISENPNADIIIKTHPDALAKGSKRTKCYYSSANLAKFDANLNAQANQQSNLYLMAEEINPIALLEIVDKVYVCTSQLGFEALMMGKEVHTFGIPFYAGYGRTIDYQKCDRRTNPRSVEEIFYIAYILHSFYVNPATQKPCEIEEILDCLIELRREYFLEFNVRCDDKNLVDLSKRDFSLNSGERQIAQSLEGIRKDHLWRYELVADFLANQFGAIRTNGADIFCGNGYGSHLVAKRLQNTQILAIDASKEAIDLANRHYKVDKKIHFANKFFPFAPPPSRQIAMIILFHLKALSISKMTRNFWI